MSVLIKGMEMPEKCGSCDLFHVESPMHCTVAKGHKTVGAPYGMPILEKTIFAVMRKGEPTNDEVGS